MAICVMASAQADKCSAQSGAHTAALVELYTAEDCSPCLPADRWLAALGTRAPAERLLAFALHVDYGDYTGAKRGVFARQRKLTRPQRMALVYTPQIMLQGIDFRGWDTSVFDEAVARINAQAVRANLGLEIVSQDSEAMTIRASAELAAFAMKDDAVLYLAAYEAQAQRRLILEWQGPFALAGGRLTLAWQLPFLPKALPGRSGAAGFVQNRRTGEVLQALALPAC